MLMEMLSPNNAILLHFDSEIAIKWNTFCLLPAVVQGVETGFVKLVAVQ
jgi:hypothetical protein